MRAGIRDVCLPRENQRDLAELPAAARAKARFHLLGRAEEILRIALVETQPDVAP